MFERPQSGERTICVDFSFGTLHAEEDFQEFISLIQSAGGEICAELTGQVRRPHPKFYLGSGKVGELKALVLAHQAELIIFNHCLSPSQERNLERELSCRVLDRSGLILDIFAARAQSYEGKLQVELAQLEHLATRLVRGWTHLERQKGGIGLRGPGETQLEMDKRMLGDRIKAIKARLAKVTSQRAQNRRARQKLAIPVIALVGYTNAGKSTLFNALTQAETYAADQLFATLDPCSRRLSLPGLEEAILVDTVGFIRDLPHELIKAFRATLEETRQADLLLHVVDASDPEHCRQLQDVDQVLQAIGADQVPSLLVYNKIDKQANLTVRVDRNRHAIPERVWISAQAKLGLECLQEAVVECCQGAVQMYQLELTPQQGKLRAQLYALQVVESEEVDERGHLHLQVRLSSHVYSQLIAGLNAH